MKKLKELESCIDSFINRFDTDYFLPGGDSEKANLEKIEKLNKILECKLLIKRIKGE